MKYNILYSIAIAFYIGSCAAGNSSVEPETDQLELMQDKMLSLHEKALPLAVENEGWLVDDTCDAMMWTSLYGTATVDFINIEAAESETEPGRFYRTRQKTCWVKGREKQRSGSTWSRDMGLSLLIYLYSQGDLETIKRHIEYGKSTPGPRWRMGEGRWARIYYSSALKSLWYQTAKKLGYDYQVLRLPNTYFKGLKDYEAHLQGLFIDHMGELYGEISDVMVSRILEHSSRLPDMAFYEYLRAKYLGNTSRIVDMCLSDTGFSGDYVRCHDKPCELAEQIFVCGRVTKFLFERKNNAD